MQTLSYDAAQVLRDYGAEGDFSFIIERSKRLTDDGYVDSDPRCAACRDRFGEVVLIYANHYDRCLEAGKLLATA